MSNLVGKTIARIEENAPGFKGKPEQSIIVLHFTDGTALRVTGDGDDCYAWIDHTAKSGWRSRVSSEQNGASQATGTRC